jgi:hypothetical protein
VNLRGVVGGATDVVLGKAAAFKQRNLRQVIAYVHAHEISAEWTSIALLALAACNEFGLGIHVITSTSGIATIVVATLAASFAASFAAVAVATATAATTITGSSAIAATSVAAPVTPVGTFTSVATLVPVAPVTSVATVVPVTPIVPVTPVSMALLPAHIARGAVAVMAAGVVIFAARGREGSPWRRWN